MGPFHIVVTCEHAGNQIPKAYDYLFRNKEKLLNSHRGWDPGAVEIAQSVARVLKARLFETRISRLLVDCNRSHDNPEVFSEYTAVMNRTVKNYLLNEYYKPYRTQVERYIASRIQNKQSFTCLYIHLHLSFTVSSGWWISVFCLTTGVF